VVALEARGASANELKALLGKGRAMKGMFEGDLVEGELEIGQVSSLISSVLPVKEVFEQLLSEYRKIIQEFKTDKYQF